jgi:hypothetical protein
MNFDHVHPLYYSYHLLPLSFPTLFQLSSSIFCTLMILGFFPSPAFTNEREHAILAFMELFHLT